MARYPLSKELKQAISRLSDKEKDKLLFRLIPKNPDLVRKLTFELLEDGETAEVRREKIRELVENHAEVCIANYYSPGYVLMDLRTISGIINQHVKTTKDKYGEIELNLYMLTEVISSLVKEIEAAPRDKVRTLSQYVAKRTHKLNQLLKKQHEDVLLDFREDWIHLGNLIDYVPAFKISAVVVGVDVEAVREGELYE
ncbi:MAG: hypothetical protein AAGI38_12735 [Bacteroidota bacterium]